MNVYNFRRRGGCAAIRSIFVSPNTHLQSSIFEFGGDHKKFGFSGFGAMNGSRNSLAYYSVGITRAWAYLQAPRLYHISSNIEHCIFHHWWASGPKCRWNICWIYRNTFWMLVGVTLCTDFPNTTGTIFCKSMMPLCRLSLVEGRINKIWLIRLKKYKNV